jgi:sec-independent protein translocase protein TatA
LDPVALASIAVVLLVFFLWGPEKIPEMARMLAQARKEFDNATKEFQKVSSGITNGTSPFFAPSTPAAAGAAAAALPAASQQATRPVLPLPTPKTGDQLLLDAARKLGIPTGGKTREQIQQEIVAMAQRPSSKEPPAPSTTGDSAS